MLPLLGGLISGGASLLGSIFSSNTSAQNTQQQIAASEQQQATANQFSERMSSTAYQRASSDMKAAGLNPMMMFGSGSAASSPSGSGIQAPMPQNKSPLGDLGTNVRQGLDAAVTAKTMDKMTEEIANIQADRARLNATTDVLKSEIPLKGAQTRETEAKGTQAILDIGQHRVGAVSASDILSLPEDVRRGIVQGKFQEPHLGGAVGGVVGALKASAKAARDWYSGINIRPTGGSSFSDRFNASYGNAE